MKPHKTILQLINRLKGGLQILSALSLLLFFYFLREIAPIPIENPDLSSQQIAYLENLAILSFIGFVGFAVFAVILDNMRARREASLRRVLPKAKTPHQAVLRLRGRLNVCCAFYCAFR